MRTQALEQAIDAVVAVDARNQITLFNAAAEALWGLERTTVLGQCASVLALGDLRVANDQSGQNLAIARADGTVRHVRLHITTFGTDGASNPGVPAKQFAAFLHDDGSTGNEPGATLSPPGLRMLSLCLDHAENPVMITDAHGTICHLNGGFTRLLGYARYQAVGRRWQDLLMPINARPEQIPSLLAPLAAGLPLRNEALVPDKSGQPRWLSVAVSPIMASTHRGGLVNTVWVLTDITATKVRESIQHRTLDALARDLPTAQIMNDLCRRVERMAPGTKAAVMRVSNGHLRLVAMPSATPELLAAFDSLQIGLQSGSCGAAAFLGHAVAVDDIAQDPRCETLRETALAAGMAATWSTPVRAADGRVLGTFALCFNEPRLPDGFHENLVGVAADLCALALVRDQTQERIHRLAYYDALTGLPNRQLLLSRADDAVARANAHGTPLALLFINLNNFKRVNDVQGHGAGDRFLIEVASRLQFATAEHARDATVGRLSGDEFAVLLPGHGRDEALAIADELLRALDPPVTVAHSLSLSPSASIGISMLTEQARDRETLLHHADLAVCQARKRSGPDLGNQICVYDTVLARRLGDRRMLESELREAIGSGQLQMRYQPQIHLASGNLWAVEALARWPHPHRGDIAPTVFVPLAEESGLIVALGYWAVREACAQQARWRRRGAAVPAISVNLSPLSIRDPALPDVVTQALRTHALPAGELTIEITESVFLDHTSEAEATIAALRKLGVRLSIDDFGTGFSSLSRLMQLPVDEIKLDRSFLVDLENSEATRTLVEAVIRIGRARDLNVVAEGVTSALQRQFLLDQGCHVGQGFLFAQPLPAASIERWQPQPSWPGLMH
ncbi:sensor domain-containing protein [Cupriavidus metallidurans]|uniref:sensor domain-containing protein n=1 Tax=Cupriavidus metallidurans TaxID=119219 RepID=UPI00068CF173|nr:EAL domain-containing protein [Cupriavidus metallidurans]